MDWINLYDPQLSEALTYAIIKSIWISAFVWLTILSLMKSGILKNANQVHALLLSGTLVISIATIYYFISFYQSSHTAVSEVCLPLTAGVPVQFSSDGGSTIIASWPIFIWLLGFVLISGRSILSLITLSSLKSRMSPIPDKWESKFDELRERLQIPIKVVAGMHSQVTIPFVMGVFRPTVIFPVAYFSHMHPRELESIILHELGHIKKWDYLINILQSMAESLLFFNPVIWWIGKEIKRYREFRIDDMVQNELEEKNTYARALYIAGTLAHSNIPAGVSLFEDDTHLLKRIKRMINPPVKNTAYPLLMIGLLFTFVFILFSFKSETEKCLPADHQPGTIQIASLAIPDISSSALMTESVNVKTESESPNHAVAQDTIPADQRINELKEQIQIKQDQLTEMNLTLEKSLNEGMEPLLEKMESLEVKFEQEIGPKLEALELELNESFDFSAFESLQVRMDDAMNNIELDFETPEFEENMRILEEKLSREFDIQHELEINMDSLGEKKLFKSQKEIENLQIKLREESRKIQQEMEAAMNNPEIRRIREEMQELHMNSSTIAEKQKAIRREVMEKWHAETSEIQEQIQNEAHFLQEDLHVEMSRLHDEMRKLQEQLRMELNAKYSEE